MVNWGRLAGLIVAVALVLLLLAILKAAYAVLFVQYSIGNWWIGPVIVGGALLFAFVCGRPEDRADFYKLWNWLTFRGWRL